MDEANLNSGHGFPLKSAAESLTLDFENDDDLRLTIPAPELLSEDEVSILRKLRAVYEIKSTKSLVHAFNVSPHEEERTLLRRWIENYMMCFTERKNEPFCEDDFSSFLELFNLRRETCQSVLRQLAECIVILALTNSPLKNSHILEALDYAMNIVASKHFKRRESDISNLGASLCSILDSYEKETFTRETFRPRLSMIFALYSTAAVLFQLQGKWNQKLYDSLIAVVQKIENSGYYPFVYHGRVIGKGLRNLGDSGSPGHLFIICKYLFYESDEKEIDRSFLLDMEPNNIKLKSWTPSLRIINSKRFNQPDDAARISNALFEAYKESKETESFYPFKIEFQKHWSKGEKRKSTELKEIRYLSFLLLYVLAEKCGDSALKGDAIEVLLQKAKEMMQPDMWRDPDIFEALLEALYGIHQSMHDPEISQTLKRMIDSDDEKLRAKANAWRKGISIDDLSFQSKFEPIEESSDRLFDKISKMIGLTSTNPALVSSLMEDLKKQYLKPRYSTVSDISETDSLDEVKSMEWRILSESKRYRTVHDLEGDLENRRSVKIEDLCTTANSEPKITLVIGVPGTGKTSLCQRIVYDWAHGLMFGEFKAIYFLHPSNLHYFQLPSKKSLALDIVRSCFPMLRREEYYEACEIQVANDFERPTSLVILDDCESLVDSFDIMIEMFKTFECKVLMTSRPSSIVMDVFESRSTILELTGFSETQLETTFKRSHISQSSFEEFEKFRSQYPQLHQLTLIPFFAKTISRFWKEKFDREEYNISLRDVFVDIVDQMLLRYLRRIKKPSDLSLKIALTDELRKIAFELQFNESVLSNETEIAKTESIKLQTLKESGFMVFDPERNRLQFFLDVFREFFAGQYIAHQLISEDSRKNRAVEKVILQGNRLAKQKFIMSIMIDESCHLDSSNALKKMVETIDQAPRGNLLCLLPLLIGQLFDEADQTDSEMQISEQKGQKRFRRTMKSQVEEEERELSHFSGTKSSSRSPVQDLDELESAWRAKNQIELHIQMKDSSSVFARNVVCSEDERGRLQKGYLSAGDNVNGRYTIQYSHPQGVYFANDVFTGEDVALKFYENDCLFRRSLTAHQTIGRTERAYRLLDVLKPEMLPKCLVFKRADKSLESLLRLRTELNSLKKKSILHEILCGINDIHEMGIVHSDIKPSNIMYFPEDQSWKLIDFDFAGKMTEDLCVGYTVHYAAPEIIQATYSNESLTLRTSMDIFSLGVIAYEFFTGQRYYGEMTREEVSFFLLSSEKLPSLNGIEDRAIHSLLRKMLVRDHRKRITAKQALSKAVFRSADTSSLIISRANRKSETSTCYSSLSEPHTHPQCLRLENDQKSETPNGESSFVSVSDN